MIAVREECYGCDRGWNPGDRPDTWRLHGECNLGVITVLEPEEEDLPHLLPEERNPSWFVVVLCLVMLAVLTGAVGVLVWFIGSVFVEVLC